MSKAQFLKENLRPGEVYAGLILDPAGDYHLFALPGEAERVNWEKAKEFARKAGGELPDPREARLLAINIPQHFNKGSWYWTSGQGAGYGDYAWVQDFSDGIQVTSRKSNESRARAVRRVLIGEAE